MATSRSFPLFAVTALFAVSIILGIASCGSDSLTAPGGSSNLKYSQVEEESFSVGSSSRVNVENFVGKVTIRNGAAGTIRVVATRRAASEADLERIDVDMTKQSTGVFVKAANPSHLNNVAAELEITVPAEAGLDIDLGVGDIDYQGRPVNGCKFDTGVGSIRLVLPADVSVYVELTTGVGTINLDFTVEGQVTQRTVFGDIGQGYKGEILAHTGVGDISLFSL